VKGSGVSRGKKKKKKKKKRNYSLKDWGGGVKKKDVGEGHHVKTNSRGGFYVCCGAGLFFGVCLG